MRIMVIAGTADARSIIEKLLKSEYEVFATVTTDYGKELLATDTHLEVHQGKLDAQGMLTYIMEKEIYCVVDASHPFAKEASMNAIYACTKADIPYLRFERESVQTEFKDVIRVKTFEEAAIEAKKFPGNILLTIGSNNIKVFTDNIPNYKDRLFVRILPTGKMLSRCEEAGLTAQNIFAIQGPFSLEMNVEMLKHCRATVLVTKESGEIGGTLEKLEAAVKLGIKVILIERPNIDYGKKVCTLEQVSGFIRNLKEKGRGL